MNEIKSCLDCPLRGTRFSKGEQWDVCQHPQANETPFGIDCLLCSIPNECPLRQNPLILKLSLSLTKKKESDD